MSPEPSAYTVSCWPWTFCSSISPLPLLRRLFKVAALMRTVTGGLLSLFQLKLKVQPLLLWRGWRTVSVSPLTLVSISAIWRRRPLSSMLLPGWLVTITRNGPSMAILLKAATLRFSVVLALSVLLSVLLSAWLGRAASSRVAATAAVSLAGVKVGFMMV